MERDLLIEGGRPVVEAGADFLARGVTVAQRRHPTREEILSAVIAVLALKRRIRAKRALAGDDLAELGDAAPFHRIHVACASDSGAHVAGNGSTHQRKEAFITRTGNKVDSWAPGALGLRANGAIRREEIPDRSRSRVVVVLPSILAGATGKNDGAIVQRHEVLNDPKLLISHDAIAAARALARDMKGECEPM